MIPGESSLESDSGGGSRGLGGDAFGVGCRKTIRTISEIGRPVDCVVGCVVDGPDFMAILKVPSVKETGSPVMLDPSISWMVAAHSAAAVLDRHTEPARRMNESNFRMGDDGATNRLCLA